MDNEELFEKFRATTAEILAVDRERVTLDARFGDDLEADSLALIELMMALEDTFDVQVGEDELEGVETVEQAFALVSSKL